MKSRFTTIDICAAIQDLQRFLGLRVNNVYDIDNKTYLIRLAKPDQKVVLLIESGLRFHSTEFEWPKNNYPSGFAMKMRKHISGRRFVKLSMLGIDRILDFQFGSNEAAYHLIVELYDRGNIILTDYEYTILSLLRTRTDSEEVRFAVRERYPVENARQLEPMVTPEKLQEILAKAKAGEPLKKILNPHFVYSAPLLDHCLHQAGFEMNSKLGKDVNVDQDIPKIMEALANAEKYLETAKASSCKGYIIQKREKKASGQNADGSNTELLTYQEFHPFKFDQHKESPCLEFDSFDKAVDEFFSKLESQKLDTKALQQEKTVLKKLDNVKKDHKKRLEDLQKTQEEDKEKARLIEVNLPLVDQAIKVVNSAIASQIDWVEINSIVKEAQGRGDSVAMAIKGLKLEKNHITMKLKDNKVDSDDSGEDNQPGTSKQKASVLTIDIDLALTAYANARRDNKVDSDDSGEDNQPGTSKQKASVLTIDIDLALTAYANARSYYTKKRQAATKEQRTVEASQKALKSAEKKTKETLKEVATTTSIRKARKVYWFEKFFWFISSENYLVIGGRDQQQNEMIVKRHLRPGDIYVHADLHGASSIVIKNSGSDNIPPKTLNEAGCMAICYSIAWQNRVITSAWWVYDHQVSKTAPTGEYLTTGSFMIRGKKNFLPPSYLILGFGFLFRLDESCVERHRNERKPKWTEEEEDGSTQESSTDVSELGEEITIEEDSGEDSDGTKKDNEGHNEDNAGHVENNAGHVENNAGHVENNAEHAAEDNEDNEGHDEDNEGPDEDNDGHGEDNEGHDEDNDGHGEDNEGHDEDNEGHDEDLGVSYPDTSIDLQYTSGGKFQLQRGTSHTSSQADEDFVDLGDGEVLDLRTLGRNEQDETRKQRLSAKQRRQMRKKGALVIDTATDRVDEEEIGNKPNATSVDAGKTKDPPPQQQVAPKRGKKGKLKKIKEKYGDQDEEDRQLMMQILGSASAPKETKSRKKSKDSKGRKGTAQGKQGGQGNARDHDNSKSEKGGSSAKNGIDEKSQNNETTSTKTVDGGSEKSASENSEVNADNSVAGELHGKLTAEVGSGDQAREEGATKIEDIDENESEKDNLTLLDSLTGCPLHDDLTQFAIPVCAPYTAVQNYKYKVKLTPGTGRRGKAARTALHSFIQSRDTTAREKDLLKSVKDADLSRHIPGKVKISAPNLRKSKK